MFDSAILLYLLTRRTALIACFSGLLVFLVTLELWVRPGF